MNVKKIKLIVVLCITAVALALCSCSDYYHDLDEPSAVVAAMLSVQ